MTPQERQLIDDLFDRLAKLEASPRDADAERTIAEGLARAPHAIYPLVQTVLVQDEALRRADARIRELTGEDEAPAGGGFLDSMRAMFTGQPARGSVPTVRPGVASGADPRYGGQAYAAPPAGGGSFLGTAGASAAGVIGGALLLNTISSMFGHRGSAFAGVPPSNSPWDDNAAPSDLSRAAGYDDIGRDRSGVAGNYDDPRAGFFGGDDNRGGVETDSDFGDSGDFGGDSGGGDPGGGE